MSIQSPLKSARALPGPVVMVMVMVATLTACSADDDDQMAATQLPVSINAVMASLINHSADPIWIAAWRNPETDEDWRELQHLATQLEVGGALITIPGAGPIDSQWTGDPQWREYAQNLSLAAANAADAAANRDIEGIQSAGDQIVDLCEACHRDFKPDTPTMNIFGELSPTADDLQ